MPASFVLGSRFKGPVQRVTSEKCLTARHRGFTLSGKRIGVGPLIRPADMPAAVDDLRLAPVVSLVAVRRLCLFRSLNSGLDSDWASSSSPVMFFPTPSGFSLARQRPFVVSSLMSSGHSHNRL